MAEYPRQGENFVSLLRKIANNTADIAEGQGQDQQAIEAAEAAQAAAAEAAEAAAGATAAASAASAVGVSLVNPYLASKAPRPGIVSTGASYVGQHGVIGPGTSSFSIGAHVLLPDTTPASTIALCGNGGNPSTQTTNSFRYQILSTGAPHIGLRNATNPGGTGHTAATLPGVPDNSWAFFLAVVDRAAKTVTHFCNGTQLGSPVAISSDFDGVTLTSSAALQWFAQNSNTAGTLGESWIVLGALSSTRAAEISRAGSIAPFCTYTANATTGQNTATIDGFDFLTWPDFGRADPVNNPIAQDRSGNNQHAILGTSGLTAAVPLTWRNTAPASVIVSDGSGSARAYNTLNNQNPGTGNFTLSWRSIFPQEDSSSTRIAVALTSNTTTVVQGRSALWSYSSIGLRYIQFGASTVDYRRKISIQILTQLRALAARGIATQLDAVRDSFGVRIFLGIGNDAERYFDVTNLFTEEVGGSPPTWTDQINGQYLVAFYDTGTVGSAQSLSNLALLNCAPTEAELRSAYARGWIVPEWAGASKVATYTSDYSSTTDGWTGANGASVGVSGGKLQITLDTDSAASGTTKNLSGAMVLGATYRIRFTHRLVSGGGGNWFINNSSYPANWVTVGGSAIFTPAGDAETAELIVFTKAATGSVYLWYSTSTGQVIEISNFTVERLGFTTRLLVSQAAGLTAPNTEAANGSTDFLLSSSGVSTPPENRRQIIRPGTLTFTSPGTLNLQLFGASVVDTTKKWRIVSVSGTANGAANLSLGSASGGAQYISAQAVTSGDFDLGTFASRRLSGANLWLKSDATVTITDLVVIIEQVS